MSQPVWSVNAAAKATIRDDKSRRRQRREMVVMVMISYAVDFALMLALSVTGAIDVSLALLYLSAGAVVSIAFYHLLGTGWSDHFKDHYLAGPQMLAHATVNLTFTVLVPQIGILLLMILFLLFAFGALRVDPKRFLSGPLLCSGAVGAATIAVIAIFGDQLALPAGTVAQRVLCGIWVALVLARSMLVGVQGARLRLLLNKRNAELASTFEKLETLASRDELTGALNRRSVMRLLHEERQRMERTGQRFGVAIFDIDHFKRINDDFGHGVGDEALRRFTQGAASTMRSTDRLGRYGGEEFLMLLTETADESAASAAAERVRSLTSSADWEALARGLSVTVSAGVAICRMGETAEQLIERADQALYAAKRAGRDCVRVH